MAGNRTIPRLWRDAVAQNTGTSYLVEENVGWREVVLQKQTGRYPTLLWSELLCQSHMRSTLWVASVVLVWTFQRCGGDLWHCRIGNFCRDCYGSRRGIVMRTLWFYSRFNRTISMRRVL